jgi:hypothetical protein
MKCPSYCDLGIKELTESYYSKDDREGFGFSRLQRGTVTFFARNMSDLGIVSAERVRISSYGTCTNHAVQRRRLCLIDTTVSKGDKNSRNTNKQKVMVPNSSHTCLFLSFISFAIIVEHL